MIFMRSKIKVQKKVRIGGTIDSDVADWLLKTKGKEKFSAHLNKILRNHMEREIPVKAIKAAPSLEKFQNTLENIINRIKSLQSRVESLESSVSIIKPGEIKVKRARGRPRKVQAPVKAKGEAREAGAKGEYNVRSDINWYLSRDKYKKIKADALINAFDLVMEEFNKGNEITVSVFKEEFNRQRVGVPYPTFRLFYFPLIRDRLMEKNMIEKVEHAGKKGVYIKK
jgi:hypothetical protein